MVIPHFHKCSWLLNMQMDVLGFIPREFAEFVKQVLHEFFERIKLKPDYIEIYIYESSEYKLNNLIKDAILSGVLVVGDYVVSHDAWFGWPRIHVDYEKCKSLDSSTLRALLTHEAAHSVLHGNIKSYLVTVDIELMNIINVDYTEIIYLASTVIKDLEVHEFLLRHGFRNEVMQYYVHFSRELHDTSCSSIKEILDFAKLTSPCVFINCEPNPLYILNEQCKNKYPKILTIMRQVHNAESNIGIKANLLIKGLLNLN